MLSDGDRNFIEDKFNRLHERIDEVEKRAQKRDSDIHHIELLVAQLKAAGCPSVLSHEDKHHNPVKTWGIMAAMMGFIAGAFEVAKYIFKIGGKT